MALAALRALLSTLELALTLIPDDELKAHLTETARKIADKIADLAEAVKFG